jgi:hypothetical protein
VPSGHEHERGAEHGDEAGQEVPPDRATSLEAGVQQNAVVSDLLRDLVEHDGDRGRDAERWIGDVGGGDGHAVHEVVGAVAQQVERRERWHVHRPRGDGVVLVRPEVALEDEEREKSGEDGPGDRATTEAARERLGDQVEKSGAQECADGEAHEPAHCPAQRHLVRGDEPAHDERDGAHEQNAGERAQSWRLDDHEAAGARGGVTGSETPAWRFPDRMSAASGVRFTGRKVRVPVPASEVVCSSRVYGFFMFVAVALVAEWFFRAARQPVAMVSAEGEARVPR